jgi:hypothetical protein
MRNFRLSDLEGWVRSLTAPQPSGPRVAVEDVCHQFYDRQLLGSGDGADAREGFFDSFENAIARADGAFAQLVDEDGFRVELTAIRFELFGLAITRSPSGRSEDVCLRELVATQRYLEARDEARIWESMGHYNQAVAEAGLRHPKRRSVRGRRLGFRLSLTERWGQAGVPHGCIARYANRLDGDNAWESGHAFTALVQAMTRRLRIPMNSQAQLRLHHLLYVFYDEPLQKLRQVRLV